MKEEREGMNQWTMAVQCDCKAREEKEEKRHTSKI